MTSESLFDSAEASISRSSSDADPFNGTLRAWFCITSANERCTYGVYKLTDASPSRLLRRLGAGKSLGVYRWQSARSGRLPDSRHGPDPLDCLKIAQLPRLVLGLTWHDRATRIWR